MEKKTLYREHSGYTLMPFPAGQGDKYYTECLHKLDLEVARLTGTAQVPPREAVVQYCDRAVSDPDRFDFLIVAPDGRFIGESVLNELDRDARRANFRIVIFDRSRFCQGPRLLGGGRDCGLCFPGAGTCGPGAGRLLL